jgi:hypothetical protein
VIEVFEDAFLDPGEGPDPVRTARLRHRFTRSMETDAGGAWVVEQDGVVVGVGRSRKPWLA